MGSEGTVYWVFIGSVFLGGCFYRGLGSTTFYVFDLKISGTANFLGPP